MKSPTTQQAHWESVYSERANAELSWYQDDPTLSLNLILQVAPDRASRIMDAGAGAARLVDRLIKAGYTAITLADLSGSALADTRARLGDGAAHVRFIVGDLLRVDLPGAFDVWHDRAVFHFLTAPEDRGRYVKLLEHRLVSGGHLILATFALDGPVSCSGLPVCRYDAPGLASALGPSFELLQAEREEHTTPWGTVQPFTYGLFRRR